MSTSGFGHIPSSGIASSKNTGRSAQSEVVKIIRLPDGLQNNAKALRLEGTVTQINNNGSARIQTERGPIDVQFPNNNKAQAPEAGQKIEVNIPRVALPVKLHSRDMNALHLPYSSNHKHSKSPPIPQDRLRL